MTPSRSRDASAALARQTVAPLEVIVVDNGSIDGSVGVATDAGARVLHESRAGIPATASRGYDAARGAVIARLDADSLPPVDWIERIVVALDGDDVAAVTGPGVFAGLDGWRARSAEVLYMGAYFRLMHALLGRTPLFGSNFAMRADAWQRARGRVHRGDAEVHDDLDLSAAFDERDRIRLLPDLRVEVSSRPFRSVGSMATRVRRGVRAIRRIPHDAPASPVRHGAIGAAAGVLATVPMTAVLALAQRRGALPRLPPTAIVDRVAPGVPGPVRATAATLLHLAIGGAAGLAYGVLGGTTRPSLGSAARHGLVHGAFTWACGYLLAVPAADVFPRADHDRRDRQLGLLLAHGVYGLALGLIAHRRRRPPARATTV